MKVLIKEEVYDDLIEAVRWYEKQSPNLGIRFFNEWEEALATVAKTPFIFQFQYKNFRHSKINRFPYLIIFEIEDSLIIVYAVIHAHRKSSARYKRKRILKGKTGN
jgi:toxin ParE1/3/4